MGLASWPQPYFLIAPCRYHEESKTLRSSTTGAVARDPPVPPAPPGPPLPHVAATLGRAGRPPPPSPLPRPPSRLAAVGVAARRRLRRRSASSARRSQRKASRFGGPARGTCSFAAPRCLQLPPFLHVRCCTCVQDLLSHNAPDHAPLVQGVTCDHS